MRVSPVSFKSIMVFTLNKNLSAQNLITTTFNNNTFLKNKYRLVGPYEYKEIQDGSVHNATIDFANRLNNEYKEKGYLPKGSNKVILTVANFTTSPTTTEKKYYLTAASFRDESKIQKEISKSRFFVSTRFY